MSKRIEAQDGNISINPITGVVEVYNVNSLVTQTTTAALGGLLVDQGLGLSPVITESTLPLTDGTADGDMLYWDQTGTQTFLASSNISWSETNQRLTLGDTGHKAGKDVSAFTFFNNADDKIMSFTDTDGGVILIEEAAMRFQAGNYLEIFGTGGGRSRIETDATNRLHFTLDTGIIGAAFDYPIAILRSNGAPPAAYGGHAQLWVAGHSSFTDVHMSMNGDGITWPIANYTELNYRFNNPTAAADPGDNFMRVNNAAFASATELYFDDLDYGENDTAWFWSMLAVGDTLQLHQGTDSTRWMHCRVDSITDNTGWYTIGITPLEHNGTVFINGDDVRVMVVRTSLGTMGNIGGSIADNQIAVGAATANDIEGSAEFTWDVSTGILTIGDVGSADTVTMQNNGTDFNIIGTDNEIRLLPNSDQIGLECLVNGSVRLYNNNVLAAQSTVDGFEILSRNSDYTQDNLLTLSFADFTDKAEIGFKFTGSNNDALRIDNLEDSAHVIIRATTAGSSLVPVFWADPDASTDIWAASVEAKRIYAGSVQTTDATTTEILAIAEPGTDGAFGFEISIIGNEAATSDAVYERIVGAATNDAGTLTIIGGTIVDRVDEAGASTWTIAVSANNTSGTMDIDVTGEAAHTIDWKCRVEIIEV